MHPREWDAHVVKCLCNLQVDSSRKAAEDHLAVGEELGQSRCERSLPGVGRRSEEHEPRPRLVDRLEEFELGKSKVEKGEKWKKHAVSQIRENGVSRQGKLGVTSGLDGVS